MTEQVTTTAGEPFTAAETEILAALILQRFGWEVSAAAAGWRRLLGNNCPDADFRAIAVRGIPLLRSPTAFYRARTGGRP